MSRIVLGICLVAAVASGGAFLALHVGSYAGVGLVDLPRAGALHLLSMALSIAGAFGLHEWAKLNSPPRWLTPALLCLAFYYTACHFLGPRDGNPERTSDGGYAVISHGKTVRRLSAAEYRAASAAQLRSASFVWLVGAGVGITGLLIAFRKRTEFAGRLPTAGR